MIYTTRRVNYKLKPDAAQKRALSRMGELTRVFYNAVLEQRILGHRIKTIHPNVEETVNRAYQENEAKTLGKEIEGWDGLVHSHTTQLVIDRVNKSFQGFFTRAAKGEKPGFPRFKGRRSSPSWGYKTNGTGYKISLGEDWHNGHVTLTGVGRMRILGRARYGKAFLGEQPLMPGDAKFKAATVKRNAHGWFISVEAEIPLLTRPSAEGPAVAIDWNVTNHATTREAGGEVVVYENFRLLNKAQNEIKSKQKALSKQGADNRRKRAHKRKLARASMKVARKRADRLHKMTSGIIKRNSVIVAESLNVAGMTESANNKGLRGWKKVMKKGLNRSILDTAPSTLYFMLGYKAQEAGSEFRVLDGKEMKASQTCPECGARRKKRLSERVHDCPCGCKMDRDEASCLVVLRKGFGSGVVKGVADPVKCAREARGEATEKRKAGKAVAAQKRRDAEPNTPGRRADDQRGVVETPTIS